MPNILPVGEPLSLLTPENAQVERRALPEHEIPIYEGFPTNAVGMRKGNLGPLIWPPPHALTSAGLPFKNLRGGR